MDGEKGVKTGDQDQRPSILPLYKNTYSSLESPLLHFNVALYNYLNSSCLSSSPGN